MNHLVLALGFEVVVLEVLDFVGGVEIAFGDGWGAFMFSWVRGWVPQLQAWQTHLPLVLCSMFSF